MICMLLIGENIHLISDENFEVLESVRIYIRVVTVSTIPYLLFLAVKQFSDGLSHTKPAMIITFIGVVINILLNYILP